MGVALMIAAVSSSIESRYFPPAQDRLPFPSRCTTDRGSRAFAA